MIHHKQKIKKERGLSSLSLDKSNIRKLRGLIIFTVLVLMGIYRFDIIIKGVSFSLDILFPFILGGAIAFVLNVPMEKIHKLFFAKAIHRADLNTKKGKILCQSALPISLVATIVFVCMLLFIVIAVVVPELVSTLEVLVQTLPPKIDVIGDKLIVFLADYPDIVAVIEEATIDWEGVLTSVLNFFSAGATVILGSTISVATSVVNAIIQFFIAFVFACYMLMQKQTLSRQIKKMFYAYLPETVATEVIRIGQLTYTTFANFLAGQCMEAIILGMMFFIAMNIFRFPYALLVGVLISFTALIPIFGAFIGCVVGTFLILTINPLQALAFLIMFLVLQQIEGNMIYPYVVGGSVGLPSIWVLGAVTVGGSLFGVVGMLVFIPLVSVLYTLLRENVGRNLTQKGIKVE